MRERMQAKQQRVIKLLQILYKNPSFFFEDAIVFSDLCKEIKLCAMKKWSFPRVSEQQRITFFNVKSYTAYGISSLNEAPASESDFTSSQII